MLFIELFVGLALLLGGGEVLIRGAVAVARQLGVSPLLIGLTLVGYGTSTPELVASINAAWVGAPGVAAGNVVGSNIANILLILGISALIFPVRTTKAAFYRDGTMLIVASVLLLAVTLNGLLSRWIGFGFLLVLLGYTIYTYLSERGRHTPAEQLYSAEADAFTTHSMSLGPGIALAIAGIVGVVVGASLLVDSAIALARQAGLSEAVIGLTLVAVGTSLPELATSVMAALRRQSDIAFGNIVGSNIYNVLGILGVTGLLTPIPIPPEIMGFDIWVMMATALLLVVFAVTGWRVSRREGAVFLAAYVLYLLVLLMPGVGGFVTP